MLWINIYQLIILEEKVLLNKKIIVLTILLVSLLAISAVSAADNATSDVVGAEETITDAINVEEEKEVVSAKENQVFLGNESQVGTFDELSSLITNTFEGGTLELDKDYKYINGSTEGISIDKQITIDGKGHIVDGNNLSKIFNINEFFIDGNIVLKNISFINGYTNNNGAAIYADSVDLSIVNCNFINCFSKGNGCGISIDSDVYLYISNCSFINCSSKGNGGAMSFGLSSNGNIANCSFVNCSSKGNGGGICFDVGSKEGKVVNCSFESCSARYGGAIYVDEESTVRIISSTLKNNKETYGWAISGGIIFDCKITDDGQSGSSSKNNYGEIVPEEIISDDDGIVTLKFPKDAEGTVEVFINGTSVAVVNIVNGIANIDLSRYKGNYILTFGYSGDNNYPAFIKNSNVTINVITTVIIAKNAKVTYSAGSYYKITVYESKGVIAKIASVVIKSNNKLFKTLTTNNNGIANFKVTQVPGTYKLKITSLGKTVTKTLTVKHIVTLKAVKVKKSAKKLILQATLAKVNKKYLKKKTVTFKFNGKKYKAKTNSKGVAKVTIKKSVLKKLKVGKKVTYQASYLKDTVKKTVKVKK